ncbi:hypothetical protein C8A01DRAFT_20114 [Parachaetomium inaequale]|uniref:LysM domain-containing protein n=1 Tax=Parachaetomium inaequale TaxID=2588326 RepID=A0AAN6PAR5_9PEZI|nr:hypothetical protein C8A01DRAFT_20114 [Parachaetomium inaequale]
MASLYRLVLSSAALASWAVVVTAAAVPAPGPSFPNSAKNCNKWYLAKTGDDCSKAAAAGGITSAQFFQWNPDVSTNCATNFWPDYYYCIGVDPNAPTTSVKTTSKTSSTTAKTSSTTAKTSSTTTYSIRFPTSTWNITTPTRGNTFPPVQTQSGQVAYCIDWHYVTGLDTCPGIANLYGLGTDDLLDWNPALRDDCSGLAVNYWVCVRIQPRSSVTLTYGLATGTLSVPDGTPWTPTPLPPVNTSFTPSPTQGALPKGCQNYYIAAAGDRCTNVLDNLKGLLTQSQFFAWNPFLNNNCDGLWAGYYYCVFVPASSSSLPDPPTASTKPAANLAPGGATDCVKWYRTSWGDDCDLVVSIFGRFSRADFLKWNPSVGSDCAGIKDELYYCVAVPGTPTTRTAAIPPFPTGGGSTTSTVKPPTTTTSTARATTTSTAKVSTTTMSKVSTTVKPPTTTTSTGAVTTPSPIQPGMIAGCKRFYQVVSGDGCWAIANSAGIDLSNFYKWNPGIDSASCSNLWPGYYVCIGV